ncbi:hypothetical protein PtA15_15A23 [Puccinia triticina]|uniref:Uncharacterized protein n=1 Tax=Puccinia triticina TaxID=208348 RepID=A0ABY7D210_9BASI|nr:uncharacterized protein PtA15_15A23 [Puccinia triticina]WAQ91634.1 hypothetical protein PtA15_15A23 [Puccinia triticina]
MQSSLFFSLVNQLTLRAAVQGTEASGNSSQDKMASLPAVVVPVVVAMSEMQYAV